MYHKILWCQWAQELCNAIKTSFTFLRLWNAYGFRKVSFFSPVAIWLKSRGKAHHIFSWFFSNPGSNHGSIISIEVLCHIKSCASANLPMIQSGLCCNWTAATDRGPLPEVNWQETQYPFCCLDRPRQKINGQSIPVNPKDAIGDYGTDVQLPPVIACKIQVGLWLKSWHFPGRLAHLAGKYN